MEYQAKQYSQTKQIQKFLHRNKKRENYIGCHHTKDELIQDIICANYEVYEWKLEKNFDIPFPVLRVTDRRRKRTTSLFLLNGKCASPRISAPTYHLTNHAETQIVQIFFSAVYRQWSALCNVYMQGVNVEGFVETLFMIQLRKIMMRLKRTLKLIMLRIFDVNYQIL